MSPVTEKNQAGDSVMGFNQHFPKDAVPAQVQELINCWVAFDVELPITRQVKYLIVRELTK